MMLFEVCVMQYIFIRTPKLKNYLKLFYAYAYIYIYTKLAIFVLV